MKDLITIGLPSKGRLKEGSINFFEKNNFKLTSNGGEKIGRASCRERV